MKEKLQIWLSKRPEFLWAASLFVCAFLLYANTLGHQYAWDDDIVIVYNSRVQKGFAGIPEHFVFRTRSNFEDFTGYRPIAMTSFSIDVGLFGLNPRAGHGMNVLLFSLLVVVMFRTLRRLFPNFHAAFAFFITLLFTVHPIHVEAVANIKSRDEILALLFALLALNCFVQHYDSGKWLQLGLSALFLTMGAMCKEGALTYLAVIPMAIVFLRDGGWKRKAIALAKYPILLLFLGIVFLGLTGKMPGSPSQVAAKGYMESQTLGNCLATDQFEQGNWTRLGNSGFLFWKNLEKFFYPVDLVYFSGYNMYPVKTWNEDKLHLGILFTFHNLFILLTLAFWKRIRAITFGFWYFVFTIIIYLQLPGFLLADTIADRFLFSPSLGLCIVVVAGAYKLLRIDVAGNPLLGLRNLARKLSPSARMRAAVLTGLFLLLSVVLAGMTVVRNRVWNNNLSLFSHDLPLLDNCARAHYYYASELVKGYATAKDPAASKAQIITHYRRAIEITPQSYYAYVRLGQQYQNWQDYAAHAALMDDALKYYPVQADIWHGKGMALYMLGQYDDAALALFQARQLSPDADDTWEFLARAYERGGQFENALMTLEAALARNAFYPFYYDVLSDTYFDMGDTTGSFPPILKLLEMDPQNPVWWRKLIGRYQLADDADKAAYYYQQALAKGIAL
jgi:protein O-mannosyl-transferase